MASVKELRERRGQLEARFKEIVNKAEAEDRAPNAEEQATLKQIHADDMALKARIETQDQLDALGRELSEPNNRQIPGRGSAAGDNIDAGARGSDVYNLAVNGWARAQMGMDVTDAQAEACRTSGIQPNSQKLTVGLDSWASARTSYRNTLTTGQPSKGSTLIAPGAVQILETALLAHGPMLQVADLQDTDKGDELPYPTMNDTGNEGRWKGEAKAAGEADPTIGGMSLRAYELSSEIIKVSQPMMDDSSFDMVQYVFGLIGERIGRGGNRGFTTGTGTNMPTGAVPAATVGKTTASATAITLDEIIALIHSVDVAYRQSPGVALMMHDNVVLTMRTLKDTTGQYLWQPSLQIGVPDRFARYPVLVNNHMASAIAANNKTVLFGDFSKYKIRRVRNVVLKRLVEKYAEENVEGFVGFMRMDGGLNDAGTHPLKCLQQHS